MDLAFRNMLPEFEFTVGRHRRSAQDFAGVSTGVRLPCSSRFFKISRSTLVPGSDHCPAQIIDRFGSLPRLVRCRFVPSQKEPHACRLILRNPDGDDVSCQLVRLSLKFPPVVFDSTAANDQTNSSRNWNLRLPLVFSWTCRRIHAARGLERNFLLRS